MLRQPAEDALRRGLAPARLLGDRIEHREMLGVPGHQLAAELERILPDGVRQLVHEAFEVDGVLIVVHPTPEPRWNVRIAHGVIDQQVRDGVTERAFRPVEPARLVRYATGSVRSRAVSPRNHP